MTPEDLLPILQAAVGTDAGNVAYLALLEALEGQRIYFCKRVRRRLLEEAIYQMRGKSTTAISARLGVSVRTIQRINKREHRRLGPKKAA